jgi:hypothetical protein
LKVPLSSAAEAPVSAALAKVSATATIGQTTVTREAPPLVVALTMKPRAKVTPVDKDGGRTVHRGTTFPAPLIVERLEGFEGEVRLEMSSRQDRHRQGIRGPELLVPAGVSRIEYPCFMPEWLETSRTSRMILNAVTKVADARGNVRHLVNRMDGRITMSMEGALLKISHRAGELRVRRGQAFEIPVDILRSQKLSEPVRVELVVDKELRGLVKADPADIPASTDKCVIRATSIDDARLDGTVELTQRATAYPQPHLPVISESTVQVEFAP